jgi:hypothetical protein
LFICAEINTCELCISFMDSTILTRDFGQLNCEILPGVQRPRTSPSPEKTMQYPSRD